MSDSRPPPSVPDAARRADRRMYAAIGGLVIVWALVLVFRTPVQVRYWGWQLTRSDDPNWRRHYFQRLASVKEAAVPAAAGLLKDARPELRRTGVTLLHHARTPKARRLLLTALGDPDAAVREATAMGLAVNHDAEVERVLCEVLADVESSNAALAAATLGRMGGERAAEALLNALPKEPPLEVKAEVIDGLGQMRVAAAVPLLESALRDDRPLPASTLSDRLARRALETLLTGPATASSAARLAGAELELPATISELAARSLRLITGRQRLGPGDSGKAQGRQPRSGSPGSPLVAATGCTAPRRPEGDPECRPASPKLIRVL